MDLSNLTQETLRALFSYDPATGVVTRLVCTTTDANVKTFNNTLIPNNSETMSLQQYSRNAMTIDSNTNELYYSNFTEYQQKLADATSLRSAVSKLERQGFETNLGGVFL